MKNLGRRRINNPNNQAKQQINIKRNTNNPYKLHILQRWANNGTNELYAIPLPNYFDKKTC